MTKPQKKIKGIDKRRKKDFPLATVPSNYTPKYTKLIFTGITHEHVDKVASEVAQGLTIQTACVVMGIDYCGLHKLIVNPNSEIGQYAATAMLQAQSIFEQKLTKALLDPTQFNGKHLDAIKEMLQIVSPRFNRQIKIAYKYDLRILIDIIKKHVSEEILIDILNDIRTTDAHEVLANYDEQFME